MSQTVPGPRGEKFIKRPHAPASAVAQAAFSVDQFCQAHQISRPFFYILARRGTGPATMRVGKRRLISVEAAREWRERMEAVGAPR